MAIKVLLASPRDNQVLDCKPGFAGECTLVVESLTQLNSRWRSGINTAAETIDIITPLPSESFLITDIVLTSSKKVAGSTIILQLYDGVNTEQIMEIEGASVPVEFSHAFAGGLSGWKDAVFQVVTNQAAMYVVTLIAYIRVSESLTKSYNEWSTDR